MAVAARPGDVLMYALRPARPKPRQAQTRQWPAPISGWVSNRALSDPKSIDGPGAAILDNFFPKATGVALRRGKERYATLEDETLPVLALFSYRNGATEKLFGANKNVIYDLSAVPFAEDAEIGAGSGDDVLGTGDDTFGWSSTTGLDVSTGYTGGDWSVTQFATTGGIYLVGFNGADTGFIYDGTTFWPNVAGGVWYLPLASEATAFAAAETVTGSTSGAVATVYRDDTDQLVITDIVEQTEVWSIAYTGADEAFTIGSTLVGVTSGASAKITGNTAADDTWNLAYDGGTGLFVADEIVTGGTSGATATVVSVDGDVTSGTLLLSDLTGTFEDDEAITGDGAGVAVANGVETVLLNGTLALGVPTGTFQAAEAIHDGAGADAVATATQQYVSGGPFQAGEDITGSIDGAGVTDGAVSNAVPGMDFGDSTSADMAFVWSYKNRLWFVQKDSLSAWYLPVDSVGGTATEFPMGGIFANGGSLMFGARWSLESGGDGGLSDQNIFVTSQGEVAIYQGSDPTEAATWQLVGVYRIGAPLGRRAYIRGGGDLAIATTVGLVPLSKAISLDVTALNVATVSYKIADAWSDAVTQRGDGGWQAVVWPEAKLAAIAPPDMSGSTDPVMFISNTETGAWTRYTGWLGLCMETYQGQLYFGSDEGKIFKANVGGYDDGETYSGTVIPLFDDMGAPASLKIGTVGRATTRSNAKAKDRLDMLVDYNLSRPAAPDATPFTVSNTWGSGVWGASKWGSPSPTVIGQAWKSVGGHGYRFSPCYQVTSGSVSPIDLELVEMTTLYTTAENVT